MYSCAHTLVSPFVARPVHRRPWRSITELGLSNRQCIAYASSMIFHSLIVENHLIWFRIVYGGLTSTTLILERIAGISSYTRLAKKTFSPLGDIFSISRTGMDLLYWAYFKPTFSASKIFASSQNLLRAIQKWEQAYRPRKRSWTTADFSLRPKTSAHETSFTSPAKWSWYLDSQLERTGYHRYQNREDHSDHENHKSIGP